MKVSQCFIVLSLTLTLHYKEVTKSWPALCSCVTNIAVQQQPVILFTLRLKYLVIIFQLCIADLAVCVIVSPILVLYCIVTNAISLSSQCYCHFFSAIPGIVVRCRFGVIIAARSYKG